MIINLGGWLLIATAAFAYRLEIPLWVFNSVCTYDLALFIVLPLLVEKMYRTNFSVMMLGDTRMFIILMLPLVASLLSLSWSQEIQSTIRCLLNYIEAILAFLIAVNIFGHLNSQAIIARISCLVFLILMGSVFSYLGVPGFDPMPAALRFDSLEATMYFNSYHARLSHPFIGLSNNLATVFSFFSMVLLGYGTAYKDRKSLFLFWVSLVAIILTFSRGCIFSISICFMYFVFMVGGSSRLAVKICGIILISAVVISLSYEDSFLDLEYTVGQTLRYRLQMDTASERLNKLGTASEKILESPLLGYGDGVTADSDWELVGGVHNTYIQQILYFGIPLGSLLSLALWSMPWKFLRGGNLGIPEGIVSFGLGLGILSQLLIFITQTSFEGSLLKVLFYFSVGMGIALVNSARREGGDSSI
jgi:hypothetical protein